VGKRKVNELVENLLTLAKKSQKEHQWEKAIEYFNQYIKENNDTAEDSVYTAYARCTRIVGRTDAAKKILVEGQRHHPKSERILLEYHNLYDALGEWESALHVAKSLIKKNPKHADYHFRLGRSYSFLFKNKKAKKAYYEALELTHHIPFEQLIEKIQSRFAEDTSDVRSTYVFIDGKNNLGAFIHDYRGEKFITKISKYTHKNNGAGREETFYKNICADFPQLNTIVPQYVDSLVLDKISYLTIEMIDTISEHPTANHIQKIMAASQKISTIPYEGIHNRYQLPNYVFQFKKGRAISVVHFFTRIHEETFNKRLFEAVHLIMKQHKYPRGIRHLMQRLESVIMTNRLYAYMEPEKHYSLLHGDFAFQNILMKEKDATPWVIDWTSFTIGPHFIDLARYFTSQLLPYSEVKARYIEDKDTGQKLSEIERIFFLYALILFYFQKLGRKGIETSLSDYILPALEDLEYAVMKWNLMMEGDQMEEETLKELKEKDLKIQQLNQKAELLEEEREHLAKRLMDMETSKSWKITAPLRLFMERKQNKK